VSESRALLFDVGNTRLKWGVLRNDRIVRAGSIDHDKLKQQGFAPLTTRLPANVDYVLVSNVAGTAFATRLAGVIGIHCDTDIRFARSEKAAYGVKNGYRQPRHLGVDRWVALVGARVETRSAVCVVDAGTAVTIDAMDKSGQHLGGQIIPGPRLMTTVLSKETNDIGSPTGTVRDPDGQRSGSRHGDVCQEYRRRGTKRNNRCRLRCDRTGREDHALGRPAAQNRLDRGRRLAHPKAA